MSNSYEYLTKLFLKAVKHIEEGNWQLEIVNRKKFKELVTHDKMPIFPDEQVFEMLNIFNNDDIDEYAINFLLYKWLQDHDDKRYKMFSFIIKPHNRHFDMREVPLNDLINFVSP